MQRLLLLVCIGTVSASSCLDGDGVVRNSQLDNFPAGFGWAANTANVTFVSGEGAFNRSNVLLVEPASSSATAQSGDIYQTIQTSPGYYYMVSLEALALTSVAPFSVFRNGQLRVQDGTYNALNQNSLLTLEPYLESRWQAIHGVFVAMSVTSSLVLHAQYPYTALFDRITVSQRLFAPATQYSRSLGNALFLPFQIDIVATEGSTVITHYVIHGDVANHTRSPLKWNVFGLKRTDYTQRQLKWELIDSQDLSGQTTDHMDWCPNSEGTHLCSEASRKGFVRNEMKIFRTGTASMFSVYRFIFTANTFDSNSTILSMQSITLLSLEPGTFTTASDSSTGYNASLSAKLGTFSNISSCKTACEQLGDTCSAIAFNETDSLCTSVGMGVLGGYASALCNVTAESCVNETVWRKSNAMTCAASMEDTCSTQLVYEGDAAVVMCPSCSRSGQLVYAGGTIFSTANSTTANNASRFFGGWRPRFEQAVFRGDSSVCGAALFQGILQPNTSGCVEVRRERCPSTFPETSNNSIVANASSSVWHGHCFSLHFTPAQLTPAELGIPSNVLFVDTDASHASIGGTVYWSSPANTSLITSYVVLLAFSPKVPESHTILSSQILGEVSVGTNQLNVPSGTCTLGMSYILVVSKGGNGVCKGMGAEAGYVSINSSLSRPLNVEFSDTDPAAQSFAGTITWLEGSGSSAPISSYVVMLVPDTHPATIQTTLETTGNASVLGRVSASTFKYTRWGRRFYSLAIPIPYINFNASALEVSNVSVTALPLRASVSIVLSLGQISSAPAAHIVVIPEASSESNLVNGSCHVMDLLNAASVPIIDYAPDNYLTEAVTTDMATDISDSICFFPFKPLTPSFDLTDDILLPINPTIALTVTGNNNSNSGRIFVPRFGTGGGGVLDLDEDLEAGVGKDGVMCAGKHWKDTGSDKYTTMTTLNTTACACACSGNENCLGFEFFQGYEMKSNSSACCSGISAFVLTNETYIQEFQCESICLENDRCVATQYDTQSKICTTFSKAPTVTSDCHDRSCAVKSWQVGQCRLWNQVPEMGVGGFVNRTCQVRIDSRTSTQTHLPLLASWSRAFDHSLGFFSNGIFRCFEGEIEGGASDLIFSIPELLVPEYTHRVYAAAFDKNSQHTTPVELVIDQKGSVMLSNFSSTTSWVTVASSGNTTPAVSSWVIDLSGICFEPHARMCPTGWMAYSGSCYHVDLTPRSLFGAHFNCRSFGAMLASIESLTENKFIRELVPAVRYLSNITEIWIGLGSAGWNDNTTLEFTNFGWGATFATGTSGNGVSLEKASGMWSWQNSTTYLYSVCKLTPVADGFVDIDTSVFEFASIDNSVAPSYFVDTSTLIVSLRGSVTVDVPCDAGCKLLTLPRETLFDSFPGASMVWLDSVGNPQYVNVSSDGSVYASGASISDTIPLDSVVLVPVPNINCSRDLGIQNASLVTSDKFSASSQDPACLAKHGRLFGSGSWCPNPFAIVRTNSSCDTYLQIDLSYPKKIVGVATQGRNGTNQYVTHFKLEYSSNGLNWTMYQTENTFGHTVFSGNVDTNSVVRTNIPSPFVARYVRICPQDWNGSAQGVYPALRFELSGCSSIPSAPLLTEVVALEPNSSNWRETKTLRAIRTPTGRVCLGGEVSLVQTEAVVNNTDAIQLDSEDAGKSPLVTAAGHWSPGTSLTHIGSNYMYARGDGNSITFSPHLSISGTYTISLFGPSNPNRASNISVLLNNNVTYTYNQQQQQQQTQQQQIRGRTVESRDAGMTVTWVQGVVLLLVAVIAYLFAALQYRN
eukprot:c12349_g1_i1.p1 GENE.c12349_g1_i1~~c12349_g1_i1.p1  ORF type:complete len:1787 (-),score=414.20 c12349_g1_i1:28-5388(-)